MAKIAIIGSGVSGLTCSYLLRDRHDVTLFEANDYIGGHTHTHEIQIDGLSTTVDTGFIVYNDRTYPNFIRLLEELGCSGTPTEMSFSLKDEANDLEYNGHNLNTLFAQRLNLLRPSFWLLIKDILKFNRMAKQLQDIGNLSLDRYMLANGFSKTFQSQYLYPMAAAIWSTGDGEIGDFPAQSLIDFFVNHGLVDLKNRPQWYVVKGGSNQYVKAILPHIPDIRLQSPVLSVDRDHDHVNVTTSSGTEEFDEVIFACHSNEALALLSKPTNEEQSILGSISYRPNTAYLHTDTSRLPTRSLAWASWNYSLPKAKRENTDSARLTYNMNILQHIPTSTQVLVTLNDDGIEPSKIISTMQYEHPFYDQATLDAQQRHDEISGKQRTHYCGAYWSYGFHEDGVNSALKVSKALGVDW